ncbi:Inhibitor of growth protein [Operophtera brumata]|uniref:Inhibitor of growth protein n=1 Tax=Operophtera brumata TaxID=104452 RepID=A0A0L7L5J6_OPEBR|nr:Inhibitor of growth protein [Operophtera brumata]
MLYLEDYLEMIEHLPQELRDRFTEMREMDLSVQRDIQTEQADTEFSDIKRGYNKTIEEADEKMALSNQMFDRFKIRADKRQRESSWVARESRAHSSSSNISRTDTIQMQHGRRTASLKATYEAVAGGELAHHALHAHHGAQHEHGAQPPAAVRTSALRPACLRTRIKPWPPRAAPPRPLSAMNVVANAVEVAEPMEEEWTYDPNEPRYCICNQVSYGDMVACDNQDCPYEWFHYPCVGITAPPKGKCIAAEPRV